MKPKIIFFNITWMRKYSGLNNDKVNGGGKFVKKQKYGHELYNFQPQTGWMYGYGEVGGNLNINKIGATNLDESINGITVIWVANRPKTGGTYIVGWYNNATIYRHKQPRNKHYKNDPISYYVKCREKDAILLNEDERLFQIPRGKGGMGQSNLWYGTSDKKFNKQLQEYIKTGKLPKTKSSPKKKKQGKIDHKITVETIAINEIREYYTGLGYNVRSVESENSGWDLEAEKDNIKLLLEVKGLSGHVLKIGLTPNEYYQMMKKRDQYRICIVSNTLSTNPKLHIFFYSVLEDIWIDQISMKKLNISEKIAAIITVL